MKKSEFFEILEDNLDIEKGFLDHNTVLNDLESWDSLSYLIIISVADEFFNKKITISDIQGNLKVSDLMNLFEIKD